MLLSYDELDAFAISPCPCAVRTISSKFFLCHSYRIFALCCKVRVSAILFYHALVHSFIFRILLTPVFATHTKTAGCIPTIPILELAAANFDRAIPSRDEKSSPANPLESALANCDARKSFRMRFYEKCRVSLVSIGQWSQVLLELPTVRSRQSPGLRPLHILVGSP